VTQENPSAPMISEDFLQMHMELLLMHSSNKGCVQVLHSVLICFLPALSLLFGLGLSAPVFATQEICTKKAGTAVQTNRISPIECLTVQKVYQLSSLATLTS
jgi:hypothetical protein